MLPGLHPRKNLTFRVGESCDLAVVGATEKESFLQFDRDLRAALKGNDAVALSMLMQFPVRVNVGAGASISMNEPAVLGPRFSEVFSAELRSRVLERGLEQTFCNWNGVMYGNGDLWVGLDDHGYGIWVVNQGESTQPETSEVAFSCRGSHSRSVITRKDGGEFRYRSWGAERPLSGPPDTDIRSGTRSREGTGSCGHWIWTFKTPKGMVQVSELGCTSDSDPPPQGARGWRLVKPNDGAPLKIWCF